MTRWSYTSLQYLGIELMYLAGEMENGESLGIFSPVLFLPHHPPGAEVTRWKRETSVHEIRNSHHAVENSLWKV